MPDFNFNQFKPMDFSPWAQGDFDPLKYLPDEPQQGAQPSGAPTGVGGLLGDDAEAPATVNIGGITAPAPQAAPLPAQPAPKPQPLSRAGRIREAIVSHIAGDAPQGYEGLLTPEEIQGARPGLLQSLFPADGEPSAASRWQRNLDQMVQRKQMSVAAQRAQQLQNERAKIAQQIGPAPEDTEGFRKWAHRAYGLYASIGDVDSLSKMNVIMQQVIAGENEASKPVKPTDNTEWVDIGGTKELRDKTTGEPIMKDGKPVVITKTPGPRDPNASDSTKAQQQYMREQGLTDDYNKDTKTYRELALKLNNAVSELPRALAGDGAAQTNILYSFVNAMDPQSAVREGEIGLVRSAASLRAQAQQMIDKYEKTGNSSMVPVAMLNAMGSLMQRRLQSTADYVNERADYYTQRGKKWGVSTESFPRLNFGSKKSTNDQLYDQFGVKPVRKP